ncbi:MAG TPA: DUF445 family protein [Halanaerobiales bacterium]|nr:DUF445 family protein [Halanaerobiales bacterium]
MNYYYLLIPIIGAVIGYFTNYIAVKMLFRPIEPIKIPLFNFEIQGLLPSRRDELAESIAVSIEDNLLSIDNILEEFDHELIKEELNLIIEDTINKKINENFKYVMPRMLKDISREIIVDIIKEEVNNNFDDWMETLGERIKEEIDIKEMIEQKIKSFPLITLEELVLDIAERELKHIEYLGGVIGFIIGIGQLVLILFI